MPSFLGIPFDYFHEIYKWYINKEGLNRLDKSTLLRSHIKSVANMVPIDFNDLDIDFDDIDVL